MLTIDGVRTIADQHWVALDQGPVPNNNRLTIGYRHAKTDQWVVLTDIQVLELAQRCLQLLARKAGA